MRNTMVTDAARKDDAVFAALADGSRRRILTLLRRGPAPVHVLSEQFRVSRPAISRHLRVLREAGLVRAQKQGTENVYLLEAERLRLVETWLKQFWTGKLGDLKSLAEGSWRERKA